MSVFKCKMCGGDLEICNGESVGVCDSCGTKQTLPRLNSDYKINMYDRANHFRRNNDYDKAMGIYDQILNEDNTDAETYWSLVLCRYGIEYVEDPATQKRVPTVNRTQKTSVFADEDYKAAIKYATEEQKEIYQQEAKKIDDIQKGIFLISEKEEPYDVFICYKETGDDNKRTLDSVRGQEIYQELTKEGLKVFFARITLENKLGKEYEPYIYAALNSAKVMVVIGTRTEYFQAVWVKNEWSRFMALQKNGAEKTLIPAYQNIDPYNLPDEFSHLQALDMNKLGFIQDLVRGIKKIINIEETNISSQGVKSNALSSNYTPLIKRGEMALEDGEWNTAISFFDKALNINAELSQAYLGEWLAELHIPNFNCVVDYFDKLYHPEYEKCELPCVSSEYVSQIASQYKIDGFFDANAIFEMYSYRYTYMTNSTWREEYKKRIIEIINSNKNLSRAFQFATAEEKQKLEAMKSDVMKCLEKHLQSAEKEEQERYELVQKQYQQFIEETTEKVKIKNGQIYQWMEKEYQSAIVTLSSKPKIAEIQAALELFERIKGYKDSANYAEECKNRLRQKAMTSVWKTLIFRLLLVLGIVVIFIVGNVLFSYGCASLLPSKGL